jgi:hypothetical protein
MLEELGDIDFFASYAAVRTKVMQYPGRATRGLPSAHG